MDLYAENILDHYRNPRNKKSKSESPQQPGIRNPKLETRNSKPVAVSHTEENLSCGDSVTIYLTIADDHIADISWEGEGCAISQAAMSMLSEEIHGKSLDEVRTLKPQDIYTLLGVPIGPRRVKCALLSLLTVHNVLRTFIDMKPMQWGELTQEM